MQPGYAFTPDTKWQAEFERSFPFRETPDQMKAIIDTKIDMERPRPMDRLICGDVGFGKTEVAVRAAFKTVMEGKQVAVLAPTTVLAQQHFEVFRQRMREYPVRIEMLSRFRSHSEQNKVLRLLREGGVDIVIGTHRLISGDVVFKDLGLVVIDEEQRFGVLHKEKFKELFKLVDVLTLSATPIPRTLYLSLVGVKDMSTIETPPPNRLPVETVVSTYDERIVRAAIDRELERQGQVFFFFAQPHREHRAGARSDCASLPAGRGRNRARSDGRRRTRSGDGAVHCRENRRACLHHDHRERSRHSECKHNHHRSCG
jgi:transcription-repair coupling factor (superfamily II helicase)